MRGHLRRRTEQRWLRGRIALWKLALRGPAAKVV